MKETQKKNAGKKVSEVVANCNFKSCQCEGHGVAYVLSPKCKQLLRQY